MIHEGLRPAAGRRMPLMLCGIFLALLLASVPSTAAPQSDKAQNDKAQSDKNKDIAEQIFDAMVQLPGNKPGFRVVHAKGIVCRGTFAATKEAADLSRAEHFRGPAVPVTVRFSNGPPDPTTADASPDAAPRGMAIRFKLSGDKATDIVSFSHNGFFVGTGEDVLAFHNARAATDRTKPHPWPIEVFLSTHPRALKFVQDPKPTPISFATEAFYGNNAFRFVDKKGRKQAGRYQILPVAGQHYLTDAEGKAKAPNFLFDELRTHLAQEAVKFRLVVQLPGPGDPTDDSSVVWPDDRKTVELGTITITSVAPDSDAAQKELAFDPIDLTDGIELSDDPLPALRSRVYMLSVMRRMGR
jgi:catalase